MGSGIAQVVAASGRRVSLHDAAPGATERGLAAMRTSLEKLAEKGGGDPDEVLGRVAAVDDLVPADLLIEAVIEDASGEGGDLPPGRRAPARPGDSRLEHLLDPDHVPRGRDRPARAA